MDWKMSNEAKAQETAQSKVAPAETPAAPPTEPSFYDQLVRLKAEFENYRKRTDREKPEFYKQGKADMLLKLLPMYDLLRSAHREIQASHAQTPLANGMDMIFREFEKLFKEEGVTVMDPVGKPYDALKHEVLGTIEKEGAADGDVADVLQDGYLLGERLLRPAKVRIAKASKISPQQETQKNEHTEEN
jgi:molecular chaperone GrpE